MRVFNQKRLQFDLRFATTVLQSLAGRLPAAERSAIRPLWHAEALSSRQLGPEPACNVSAVSASTESVDLLAEPPKAALDAQLAEHSTRCGGWQRYMQTYLAGAAALWLRQTLGDGGGHGEFVLRVPRGKAP